MTGVVISSAVRTAVIVLMSEERANELGAPVRARIAAYCLSEMEREGHELGLVTLCIGGGQGIALLLERAG